MQTPKRFLNGRIIVWLERFFVILLFIGTVNLLRFFWGFGFTVTTLNLFWIGIGICLAGGIVGTFAEAYRDVMKRKGFYLKKNFIWAKRNKRGRQGKRNTSLSPRPVSAWR